MGFAVSGVNSAVATPVNGDYSPDLGLMAEHCNWLLGNGCDGLAVLGTTGEANSFSVAERQGIVEGLLKAGIPGERMLPGTGVAAGPDTVALTKHALTNGVNRVVMLPPFYYKGMSDEGLFAAYARVIEQIGDDRLRVILYHIPQQSGVPLSYGLIGRLIAAFPGIVVGIKDSSGDKANLLGMVREFPGFAVISGPDQLFLDLLRAGGAGCITGASNLIPDLLRTIYDNFERDPSKAEATQAKVAGWRDMTMAYPQIPVLKSLIGERTGQTGWRRMRPPFVALDDAQVADMATRAKALRAG
ncbi:MAG: dihydrodipicolinate synthase family protein [Devosia sp.]